MDQLKVEYENGEVRLSVEHLCAVKVEDVKVLEHDLVDSIVLLWRDSGVQQCYQRRREYQLSDSAK